MKYCHAHTFPMTQQSEAVNILKKKKFGYSWDNRMENILFSFLLKLWSTSISLACAKYILQ